MEVKIYLATLYKYSAFLGNKSTSTPGQLGTYLAMALELTTAHCLEALTCGTDLEQENKTLLNTSFCVWKI